MKLYRYFKTSLFQKDETEVVILRVFFMSGLARVEKTVRGKYKELTLSAVSDFLDAYFVGQSIIGNTVYVVCTLNPEFEGVGLNLCKFDVNAPAGLLESLGAKRE